MLVVLLLSYQMKLPHWVFRDWDHVKWKRLKSRCWSLSWAPQLCTCSPRRWAPWQEAVRGPPACQCMKWNFFWWIGMFGDIYISSVYVLLYEYSFSGTWSSLHWWMQSSWTGARAWWPPPQWLSQDTLWDTRRGPQELKRAVGKINAWCRYCNFLLTLPIFVPVVSSIFSNMS